MSDTSPEEQQKVDKENREFLAFLDRTFIAAEDLLEIARGTLADTNKDSHYMAIMKIAATIEPLVNDILEKEIKGNFQKFKVEHEGANSLASFVVNAPDRNKKQRLALELGLISKARSQYIDAIYKVRNHYAHNIKNLHLGIHQIAEKMDNGPQILSHLCGVDLKEKHSALAIALWLRTGMYYRFAGFLADALHVLRPPQPPAGLGLLGSYGWTSGPDTPLALASQPGEGQDTENADERR